MPMINTNDITKSTIAPTHLRRFATTHSEASSTATPSTISTTNGWEILSTKMVLAPYYKWFMKAKAFYATDECVSCGKCAASCPLNNIKLVEGRPVWGDDCTHCMACINLCPKQAIEYVEKTVGKFRHKCPRYKAGA